MNARVSLPRVEKYIARETEPTEPIFEPLRRAIEGGHEWMKNGKRCTFARNIRVFRLPIPSLPALPDVSAVVIIALSILSLPREAISLFKETRRYRTAIYSIFILEKILFFLIMTYPHFPLNLVICSNFNIEF